MVKSIIDPNLSYTETTQVSKNDIGLENVQAYEVKLLDIPLYVILGSIDDTFKGDHKIVFTPIYVLNPVNNKVSKQIGLYEISSEDIDAHKDKEQGNQLVLDTLKDIVPIIFPFVSEKFLKPFSTTKKLKIKSSTKTSKSDDGDTKSEGEDKNKGEGDDKNKGEDPDNTLDKNETFKLKDKFKEGTLPWVQYYFKDINFMNIPNDGGGDCLFLSIKQAYESIGGVHTVQELRNIIADNITQERLDDYQEQLKLFDDRIKDEQKKLANKDNEINTLTEDLKQISQPETKKVYSEKLQKIKDEKSAIKLEIQDAIKEKNDVMTNPTLPYGLISRTPTLSMLREEIKKTNGDYWADQNAINILEKELNVKLIIFEKTPDRDSTEFMDNPDKRVTITCSKNDLLLESFTPDHYILIEFLGFGHYQLIRHDYRGIFTFGELPTIVKDKVVNRCLESLEKNNSSFHNIPDFRDYVNKQTSKTPPTPHNIPEGSSDSPVNSQDAINSCINGLCDDASVLIFHNNADITHNPGKAPDEKIPKKKLQEYKKLQAFQKKPYSMNWRRFFSDDYTDPTNKMIIQVNNITYPSITEFVKSQKTDKGTYQDALLSKFRDNNEANGLFFKEALLATNDAKLLQRVDRNEPVFAKDLMLLRNQLKGAIQS